MKKILVLLVFFGFYAAAQNVEVTFLEKEPLTAERYFGHDIFNSKYFSKNNIFYKQQEFRIDEFSDLQMGEISNADILNPLQILLFYRSTNTVVILDNNLVEIKKYNFNKTADFKNIGFAGIAAGNKLWLYNLDEKRMEIWNPELKNDKSVQKTVPLENEISGITTNNNYCWIYTPKKLKKFNIYAVMVKEYDFKNIEDVKQYNGDLIFLKDKKLFFLEENAVEPVQIPIEDIELEQYYFIDGILYIYDKQFIHKYKIFQP